jgi:hypothetical protein
MLRSPHPVKDGTRPVEHRKGVAGGPASRDERRVVQIMQRVTGLPSDKPNVS